jgi:cysteine desulfurase
MFLDHNAGGRVRPEVAVAIERLLGEPIGNPSSLHAAGRRARALLEEAREKVAALVRAAPADVVFTSGATESNNLAILGTLSAGDALVTTQIEHSSLLEAAELAARRGAVVRRVPSASDGRVTADGVLAAVDDQTRLVSIGWANGEIGTVQPVAEISASVRGAHPDILLHSDAVQAVATLDLDAPGAGVDLMSLAGHKLGAPAGVGALIASGECGLQPLFAGGPQERERRPGSENLLGIVAFGVAAELALAEREDYRLQALAAREALWEGLVREAAPIERFGRADGLAGTLAVAFGDLRGDALAVALDLKGVSVSTGSACAAGAPEPSHVLRAIGVAENVARGGLRLSFGPEFDVPAAAAAARLIAEVVGHARSQRSSTGGYRAA